VRAADGTLRREGGGDGQPPSSGASDVETAGGEFSVLTEDGGVARSRISKQSRTTHLRTRAAPFWAAGDGSGNKIVRCGRHVRSTKVFLCRKEPQNLALVSSDERERSARRSGGTGDLVNKGKVEAASAIRASWDSELTRPCNGAVGFTPFCGLREVPKKEVEGRALPGTQKVT